MHHMKLGAFSNKFTYIEMLYLVLQKYEKICDLFEHIGSVLI